MFGWLVGWFVCWLVGWLVDGGPTLETLDFNIHIRHSEVALEVWE